MITFIRGKYGAGLKKVCRRLKERGINCVVAMKGHLNPAYYAEWKYKSKVIVNWGMHDYHSNDLDFEIMFNPPERIEGIVNKLKFFKEYSEWFYSVPWTENKFIAETWRASGIEFYARTKLTSSGGQGIVFYPEGTEEEVVDAELYTRRVRGREYRVHLDVYSGKIIDVAQKRKMTTEKLESKDFTYNKYIKSFKNGWVHSHKDIIPLPDGVEEQILKDFKDFPLDFVAIDLIIPMDYQIKDLCKYVVLEVNTAPGLLNEETIDAYVDMFERYYKEVS